MYRLTPAQSRWIASASAVDRARFLAKGPAEACALYDMKTGATRYIPIVRGVAVGETPSDDPAAVQAEAERHREALAATAGPTPGESTLDEAALGIDDAGRELDAALSEHTLVITAILPLAGLTSENLPESLQTLLEEIDRETVLAWTWIPSFARFLGLDRPARGDGEDYDPDLHGLLDGDGGRENAQAIADAFVQALHDDCAYGFLAQASQPVPNWTGASACYSWGYTQASTHYGRSPQAAIDAALSWGKATWAAGRAAA